jgi:TonB family protein
LVPATRRGDEQCGVVRRRRKAATTPLSGVRRDAREWHSARPQYRTQELVDRLRRIEDFGPARALPPLSGDTRHEYPPIARAVRIQGLVILEILIDVDGHVRGARVLRSIPLLDEAALACVRQWEFKPSLVNGASVAVLTNITQSFVLR